MPPLSKDVSALSNAELADQLREYGVDVGPITVTTRSVYEKKLLKMLCGEEVQTPNKYEPVPDDESDEDDVMETVYTRATQNTARLEKTIFGQAETRRRVEREEPSPSRIPKYERAGDPASNLHPPVHRRPTPVATLPAKKKGIPVVVKVSIFLVLLVLAFLIVKNMESSAQSNIPQEIEAEV